MTHHDSAKIGYVTLFYPAFGNLLYIWDSRGNIAGLENCPKKPEIPRVLSLPTFYLVLGVIPGNTTLWALGVVLPGSEYWGRKLAKFAAKRFS